MSDAGGAEAATENSGVETPAGGLIYTRNHPYSSTVVVYFLLSREGSE